jgi:hypothetical protein
MYLANDETIRWILNDGTRRRRAKSDLGSRNRSPRRRIETEPEFESAASQQRCTCGECRSCLDNARWERIFAEKFADPNYYSDRPMYRGSSLSWLSGIK